jgi:subtilisin family serine protease
MEKHHTNRIHPKLRMISNGSTSVNQFRAQIASDLAIDSTVDLASIDVFSDPKVRRNSIEKLKNWKRTKLTELPERVNINVFISCSQTVDRDLLMGGNALRYTEQQRLVSATIPLSSLPILAQTEGVEYIELAGRLIIPEIIASTPSDGPGISPRELMKPFSIVAGNRPVLIGIIDAQGFDFAHPDFLTNQGETRFIRIWDQAGRRSSSGENIPFGVELTQEEMNHAIRQAALHGVSAHHYAPQSQQIVGSHATHVASIAAGNNGVFPGAMLAGVLLSLAKGQLDRRQSFYDSSQIVHGVEYLTKLADSLQVPLVINISMATNGHAHDGSHPLTRWLDSLLSKPGRALCVAAGNSGQDVPESADDIGWMMGRIHTTGHVPEAETHVDLEWEVLQYGSEDMSENELEIWYSSLDEIAVSIQAPDGQWIGPVETCQYIENQQLSSGTFLSIYNDIFHINNGDNSIAIYLSPLFQSPDMIIGVAPGIWRVRLHGRAIREGRFHAWIEHDVLRESRPGSGENAWNIPSIFSRSSNSKGFSISSLSCGYSVVSAANWNPAQNGIYKTSSQGPTRDGRSKPEIAAPGTSIRAARGFAQGPDLFFAGTGTSMASAFVAGVTAMMLSVAPDLSANQIRGILQRTARPLRGDPIWRSDAGFGVIDPGACISEARRVGRRVDITDRESP